MSDLISLLADMKQKLDEAGAGGQYEILTKSKLPKHENIGEILGVKVISCPLYDNEETLMVQAGEHEKRCPAPTN